MFEHQSAYSDFERDPAYPKGGVSAERHDIARHAYLQKRRQHTAMEQAHRRRAGARALGRRLTDMMMGMIGRVFRLARGRWLSRVIPN